ISTCIDGDAGSVVGIGPSNVRGIDEGGPLWIQNTQKRVRISIGSAQVRLQRLECWKIGRLRLSGDVYVAEAIDRDRRASIAIDVIAAPAQQSRIDHRA